jgi:hypothetical protein
VRRYLASLPKPVYLAVSVANPSPTPLSEGATPSPLWIKFSSAAAPLDRIGKDVTTDFTVTPPIAGVWHWESDTTLTFTPAADWPVGQRYRLEWRPGFLAPQALVERTGVDFRAPPITGRVEGAEFWEDPTDPKNKRAVVTFEFTQPVDKASLEQRVALKMRVGPDTKATRALGWKLTFDDTGAKAWVQSDPIPLPDEAGTVEMTLAPGVLAARGGEGTENPLTAEVSVPSLATYFRVDDASTAVVTNDRHEMERVAQLHFTAPVRAADLRDHVTVWELPKDRPAIGDEPERPDWGWNDPAEIVPEVLARSRQLDVTWLPSDPEWAYTQTFRFDAAGGRWLYVQIAKGVRAFGDYPLVEPWNAVLHVEEFPQSVQIMHEGSILALSGSCRSWRATSSSSTSSSRGSCPAASPTSRRTRAATTSSRIGSGASASPTSPRSSTNRARSAAAHRARRSTRSSTSARRCRTARHRAVSSS